MSPKPTPIVFGQMLVCKKYESNDSSGVDLEGDT